MPNEKLPRLGVGDPAPDFVLPATDGGSVDLKRCGKPVALIFLRHLA